MQHVEAGFISGEPGTFYFHPAKTTDVNGTIRPTTPRTSPLLKLCHLCGAVMHKIVNNILLTQPVATSHGIVEMVIEAVMILRDRCGTAFGGNRVATHRIDF